MNRNPEFENYYCHFCGEDDRPCFTFDDADNYWREGICMNCLSEVTRNLGQYIFQDSGKGTVQP